MLSELAIKKFAIIDDIRISFHAGLNVLTGETGAGKSILIDALGLALGNQDIMVNVTGGLKVGEPAADLGIAVAVASSFRDSSVDPQLAVVGEIGLSGELRAVSQLERRVNEAARLGFERILVPKAGGNVKPVPKGIEIITAGTVREAVAVGVRKKT